jgi:hypothetical protein
MSQNECNLIGIAITLFFVIPYVPAILAAWKVGVFSTSNAFHGQSRLGWYLSISVILGISILLLGFYLRTFGDFNGIFVDSAEGEPMCQALVVRWDIARQISGIMGLLLGAFFLYRAFVFRKADKGPHRLLSALGILSLIYGLCVSSFLLSGNANLYFVYLLLTNRLVRSGPF